MVDLDAQLTDLLAESFLAGLDLAGHGLEPAGRDPQRVVARGHGREVVEPDLPLLQRGGGPVTRDTCSRYSSSRSRRRFAASDESTRARRIAGSNGFAVVFDLPVPPRSE